MQEHHLNITRTARYCTLGTLNDQTEHVWFVCHGYGQLAPYFIKKFEAIANEKTFVVAPEALSRFYLEGFSGRVGATWMTREERMAEISDYLNYLHQLYQIVLADADVNQLKINILGFSQGSATACRWVADGKIKFDRLIIWAGYFANGIQDVIDPNLLRGKEVVLAYGKEDEFLNQIDTQQYENHIRAAIPHLQIYSFDGGHTIDGLTLQKMK